MKKQRLRKRSFNAYQHRILVDSVVVLLFLLVGAAGFTELEPTWSYLDSIYFCWITTTTVGLGDFVPTNMKSMFFLFLYGCVSLGACANLIGECAISMLAGEWKCDCDLKCGGYTLGGSCLGEC